MAAASTTGEAARLRSAALPIAGTLASRASANENTPAAATVRAASASLIVMNLSPRFGEDAHRQIAPPEVINSVCAATKDDAAEKSRRRQKRGREKARSGAQHRHCGTQILTRSV
ncbi:MAG: hypothetical protein WDN31_01190 [Hyphomicrobium sp.]